MFHLRYRQSLIPLHLQLESNRLTVLDSRWLKQRRREVWRNALQRNLYHQTAGL
jgi:hypothetical protein